MIFIDKHGRRYKKQGKPTIVSVWKMNSTERIFIEVDKYGVLCTREGAILGSFLATVATNGALAPLKFATWLHKEFKPYHQKMFSIVEEGFMLPPQTRKWGGDRGTSTSKCCTLQWLALVKLWYSEKSQRVSKINSASAKTNKSAHTCGRKSYGIRRKEMEEEMGHSPDRLTFYDATHNRKDGTYVDVNVKKLMEKAFSLRSKRSETSNANITEINEQIFDEIMGDEHNGRVRGRGKGPTSRSYFASTSDDTGAKYGSGPRQTNDDVESLKGKLQEMMNKYDEVCEKYDEMSVQYKDIKQNYEVLFVKHEEVSQTLLAMANFMSQKFPELQTPDNHHDQVDHSSSSRRSASDNNVSYDASDS
ncbi:hypothetical protein M5689_021341 [Euphorbia peplus]|nr:hypothetical protein M5689_021341 [Euphorbia peplus]